MARIIVIGTGLTGLTTALLLSRDGHAVTVLERDAAEPEGDADALWRDWKRPGVSQFRLPHQMIAYWRERIEVELPEVVDGVERLGGRRRSPIDALPVALTGGLRAGDEDLRVMSARRPVLEGALAAVAARTPSITVRRRAKAVALAPAAPGAHGVPHVRGVVIDTGVYYCRQFRNDEPRSVPVPTSLVPSEGTSLLTFPGDSDTYSLTFYVASNDHNLRGLRDIGAWERALALFPNVMPLRSASTPITGVQVLGGAADRYRSLLVDGTPVVTGLVAVGDSAVRTNPSLGRGGATGLIQGCTLRDALRDVGPDRPDELALRFAEMVEAVLGPLYRLTLDYDRNRMAEIQADIAGTPHEFTDATWKLQRALERLVLEDADALRIVLRANLHMEPLDTARISPALRAKIEALDIDTAPYPASGPTRAQLLEAVGGQSRQSVA